MQIYVSNKSFVKVYQMRSVSELLSSLKEFAKDIGYLEFLMPEPPGSQKSKEVKAFCN